MSVRGDVWVRHRWRRECRRVSAPKLGRVRSSGGWAGLRSLPAKQHAPKARPHPATDRGRRPAAGRGPGQARSRQAAELAGWVVPPSAALDPIQPTSPAVPSRLTLGHRYRSCATSPGRAWRPVRRGDIPSWRLSNEGPGTTSRLRRGRCAAGRISAGLGRQRRAGWPWQAGWRPALTRVGGSRMGPGATGRCRGSPRPPRGRSARPRR
jgi:hypothetical protein